MVTTAQIGTMGVLLLQYKLLESGIDSSPMTTDYGIDLIALNPKIKKSFTIQVKTTLCPAKGGGTGKLELGWWHNRKSPADYLALVDLSSKQIWILSRDEMETKSIQQQKDKYHFVIFCDDFKKSKHKCTLADFENNLSNNFIKNNFL